MKTYIPCKNLYVNVYNNFTYNNKKLETTDMSFSEWVVFIKKEKYTKDWGIKVGMINMERWTIVGREGVDEYKDKNQESQRSSKLRCKDFTWVS